MKRLLLFPLCLAVFTVFGNTVNLKFDNPTVMCEQNKLIVDVMISNAETTEFDLGVLTLRMLYNHDALTNPSVYHGEMDGAHIMVEQHNVLSYALLNFSPFNVINASGDWHLVGKVVFDIMDYNECANLEWRHQGIEMLHTTVNSSVGGFLQEVVNVDNFTDASICIADYCDGSAATGTVVQSEPNNVPEINAGFVFVEQELQEFSLDEYLTNIEESNVILVNQGNADYVIDFRDVFYQTDRRDKFNEGLNANDLEEYSSFFIYPNPNNGILNVNFNFDVSHEYVRLELMDAGGKTLQVLENSLAIEDNESNRKASYNLTDFGIASGVYNVVAHTSQGSFSQKIVLITK